MVFHFFWQKTHFQAFFSGSYWFMFPHSFAAQKKRDTFASAYRGVCRTQRNRILKAHAMRDPQHHSGFFIQNRQTFDKTELC